MYIAKVKSKIVASFENEKKRLDKELQKAGIEHVEMQYSGSGDSGDIDDVIYSKMLPADLSKKVETFLWNLLNAKESGWEINEGGQGEITWKVGGELKISHEQFFQDQEHSSYTLKPDKKLDKLLSDQKVESVELLYSGSGDSGDVDDIFFKSGTKADLDDELVQKVQDYLLDLLAAKEGGWENNDGGNGEIKWTIGGNIQIHHTNNIGGSNGSVTIIK